MRLVNPVAGLLSLLCLASSDSSGQTSAKPQFEVASVRSSGPRNPNEGAPIDGVRRGGPGTAEPGRISYSGVPLDNIIADAFDLSWDQISGPDWIVTERYDIVANVPPGSTKDQAKADVAESTDGTIPLGLPFTNQPRPRLRVIGGSVWTKTKGTQYRRSPLRIRDTQAA